MKTLQGNTQLPLPPSPSLSTYIHSSLSPFLFTTFHRLYCSLSSLSVLSRTLLHQVYPLSSLAPFHLQTCSSQYSLICKWQKSISHWLRPKRDFVIQQEKVKGIASWLYLNTVIKYSEHILRKLFYPLVLLFLAGLILWYTIPKNWQIFANNANHTLCQFSIPAQIAFLVQ